MKSSSKLVAPVWHTAILLFLWLAPSYWLVPRKYVLHVLPSQPPLWLIYALQLAFQWIFFLILLAGLKLRGTRLGDLIGARWVSWKSFFQDVRLGIRVVLWYLGIVVILLFLYHLFPIPPVHAPHDYLSPHRLIDLLGFIPIACTAGFTEEVAFRGYLQRQIHALTGRPLLALIVQAITFSLAHGLDEPLLSLLVRFVGGMILGVVAITRKSLLPGILAHSFQDCLVGIFSVAA